jgi:hypothetical protein
VRGVTILNSRSVFSSETGVRNGIKSEEHNYFHQLNGRKLFVVFISAMTEGVQLYNQVLDNFKRHSKGNILKCILWFKGSLSSGDDQDILKDEVKADLMAQS